MEPRPHYQVHDDIRSPPRPQILHSCTGLEVNAFTAQCNHRQTAKSLAQYYDKYCGMSCNEATARVVWSVHEFFVSVLIAPDRRHFLLYYTSGPSGTPAHYPLVPSASRRLGKEGKLQSRLLVLWLKAKSETRMETFREDETEM